MLITGSGPRASDLEQKRKPAVQCMSLVRHFSHAMRLKVIWSSGPVSETNQLMHISPNCMTNSDSFGKPRELSKPAIATSVSLT